MTPWGHSEPTDPRTVYTFWSADGSCLYVGVTAHFNRRVKVHQRKPWWADVDRIETEIHPDERAGFQAESLRIKALNPVHNRAMTDHDTVRSLPCATCRQGRHRECVGVNRDGDPCPCRTCVNIGLRVAS